MDAPEFEIDPALDPSAVADAARRVADAVDVLGGLVHTSGLTDEARCRREAAMMLRGLASAYVAVCGRGTDPIPGG